MILGSLWANLLFYNGNKIDFSFNHNHTYQAELRDRQEKYMAATRDIHKHMLMQIAQKNQQKRDQEQMDQDMLKQRIIQDEKVRYNLSIHTCIACYSKNYILQLYFAVSLPTTGNEDEGKTRSH